jgi:hypothetical protein
MDPHLGHWLAGNNRAWNHDGSLNQRVLKQPYGGNESASKRPRCISSTDGHSEIVNENKENDVRSPRVKINGGMETNGLTMEDWELDECELYELLYERAVNEMKRRWPRLLPPRWERA